MLTTDLLIRFLNRNPALTITGIEKEQAWRFVHLLKLYL
jgi:hypothetical protein